MFPAVAILLFQEVDRVRRTTFEEEEKPEDDRKGCIYSKTTADGPDQPRFFDKVYNKGRQGPFQDDLLTLIGGISSKDELRLISDCL